MWGLIPFFLMFMEVAGAPPILLRGVTVTRTTSFYSSTRTITRTMKGALKTTTFIAQKAALTTETLADQGKTITPSGARASEISGGGESDPALILALNIAPTPTPALAHASDNEPTTVTMIVTTYSTLHPSISTSSSALQATQDTALTLQNIGLVSTASTLSSQGAVQAVPKNETEGAEQSKPQSYKAVVIIEGILIGLSITIIFLFAVYWRWRRKQKAKHALFSPMERGFELVYDPTKDLERRISPFPQSVSPSTPNHKRPLTAALATPRAPTMILSALSSGMPENDSHSITDLPISPILTPPSPVKSITRTHLGRSNSRKSLTISRDMILRGPLTPPPGYSA